MCVNFTLYQLFMFYFITIMNSAPPVPYKCVIVTPAGRKRYIEILYPYLKQQRNDFTMWHLWLNTYVYDDSAYMSNLERENDWIKCIKPSWPVNGTHSIGHFFRHSIDPDTIYIRLEDDIVYLTPDFIRTLYAERLKHKEPLFVYPNIINNAIISYIHYIKHLISSDAVPKYACMDKVGWKNGKFAELVHNTFIDSIKSNTVDKWKSSFTTHTPVKYARVSINCVAWFGKDLETLHNDIANEDEEQIVSVELPKKIKRPNLIVNYPICAHFAFYPQRPHLENNTTILQQYKELSENL